MPTDSLRIEANERLDIEDVQFAIEKGQRETQRQLVEQFLIDPTVTGDFWVVDGFGLTAIGASKILRVDLGRAILGMRDGALALDGALTTAGETSRQIDMAALGITTYNIYVRFEFVDDDQASRVFWDPTGAGSEFVQTIPTRKTANWQLRVETTSPGDEWHLLGTADNSTTPLTIVDQRKLYFEGTVSGAYASGWGAGNDRNADRQLYGVKNLQHFTAAMRQLFDDIRPAGKRWWELAGLKATGQSVAEPGVEGVGSSGGSIGVKGTGTTSNEGVQGTGGPTAGTEGVKGIGGAGGGYGVVGVATGAYSGLNGSSASGPGLLCSGNATAGPAVLTPQAAVATPQAGMLWVPDSDNRMAIHDGNDWNHLRGVVYASVVDSNTVTSTIAETVFNTFYTIPANSLRVGSVINLRASSWLISVTGSTPSLTIRVRLGGLTGDILAAHVNAALPAISTAVMDLKATVRAIGAGSGEVTASSLCSIGPTGTTVDHSINRTLTADTTGSLDLVVTAEWDENHASNQIYLETCTVEIA